MRNQRQHQQARSERANLVAGFTLVELMIAVSIIGIAFLSLLTMRATAVDRTWTYTRDRRVQQLARETLEAVVYGEEEDRSGTDVGPPEMNWEVQIESAASGVNELLECTVTIKWTDEADEEQEYQLALRLFPPEESELLDGLDE